MSQFLEGGWLKREYVPPEWGQGRVTAHPLKPREGAFVQPLAFAAPVADRFSSSLERLRGCVGEFLARAEKELAGPAPNQRARHLLALPPIGVGHGGWRKSKGDALKAVVEELVRILPRSAMDVALVVDDDRKFAAAQALRRRVEEAGTGVPWGILPSALVRTADCLGAHASAGRLVVFFGAGIGVGAGLPTWGDLLDSIADAAHLDPREQARLEELDFRDQARLLEQHLGGDKNLRAAVEKKLDKDRHSLGHALLANLPAFEFVTTNYDTLFESAFESAFRKSGRHLRVLPYEVGQQGSAWLLKLHGSLHHDDLVLTRRDYLNQVRNRTALNGIVQALLMTRHMLFTGYSLRDEDFHQVVDEVLSATGELAQPLGTALMTNGSQLEADLWNKIVQVVPAKQSDGKPTAAERAEGGRLVEIVLDRVIAKATEGQLPYLLDPTFSGILSNDEQELVSAALPLAEKLAGTGWLPAVAEALPLHSRTRERP